MSVLTHFLRMIRNERLTGGWCVLFCFVGLQSVWGIIIVDANEKLVKEMKDADG